MFNINTFETITAFICFFQAGVWIYAGLRPTKKPDGINPTDAFTRFTVFGAGLTFAMIGVNLIF